MPCSPTSTHRQRPEYPTSSLLDYPLDELGLAPGKVTPSRARLGGVHGSLQIRRREGQCASRVRSVPLRFEWALTLRDALLEKLSFATVSSEPDSRAKVIARELGAPAS
jgi:hypothetical protein